MGKAKTKDKAQIQLSSDVQMSIPASATKATTKPAMQKMPKGKCPLYVTFNDNTPDFVIEETYMSMDNPGTAVFQDLTGTNDMEIAEEIFRRGFLAMPKNNDEQKKFNTIFQSLSDCEPKDSVEAKLCMQGTALYAQGMEYLRRGEHSNRFDHSEFYMKFAIKLLRLHNETIEALCKHRRGGEQRVVVQHVNVNDGGQAIVGSILNGGGVNRKNDEVPHGHSTNL